MKYETPELTALTPAINAIQTADGVKNINTTTTDSPTGGFNEVQGAYVDWE
jgi:hypothetical protein